MTRRGRVEIKGFYYHIMARGQRKDRIFLDQQDMQKFLEILENAKLMSDTKVMAFCLMPNHYHLLLQRGKIDISRIMRIVNTKYALYFNGKYKLFGHVFQDRYKSYIILSEKYLFSVIRYIHNNPVRKGMVENPSFYRYSSANDFAEGKKEFIFLDNLNISNNHEKDFYFDEVLNSKNEFIGTEHEYVELMKRGERHNLDYKMKRKNEINIHNDYTNIINNLGLSEVLQRVDKKRICYELYNLNYTQKEIAKLLRLAKNTVSKWLNEENGKKGTTVPKIRGLTEGEGDI